MPGPALLRQCPRGLYVLLLLLLLLLLLFPLSVHGRRYGRQLAFLLTRLWEIPTSAASAQCEASRPQEIVAKMKDFSVY